MDHRKSPVTCMIIVNDYLWVGSHSGAKVYDAANRKTKGQKDKNYPGLHCVTVGE